MHSAASYIDPQTVASLNQAFATGAWMPLSVLSDSRSEAWRLCSVFGPLNTSKNSIYPRRFYTVMGYVMDDQKDFEVAILVGLFLENGFQGTLRFPLVRSTLTCFISRRSLRRLGLKFGLDRWQLMSWISRRFGCGFIEVEEGH